MLKKFQKLAIENMKNEVQCLTNAGRFDILELDKRAIEFAEERISIHGGFIDYEYKEYFELAIQEQYEYFLLSSLNE